ncbi:LysM peptidoglycan-binding domain-containing protein [Bacillus solimangrovi]|uniref:LysM domain-containing protein n=1 Tax=Bacillus solimangrovi TaxID=1305675 RepID=A0A1E5LHE9_9BACI|nr:LysM peptidoglycan-binding domain-containing protein [Bacillus solimangrovi]OEH93502.1 hypothetical protein BFG57_00470 [Bacillus solimangrovi]
MSNEEKDQAELLRSLVKQSKSEEEDEANQTIPPRSQVHGQKQGKTNIKIKYPLARLLVLIFLLLLIIIPAYAFLSNKGDPTTNEPIDIKPSEKVVEQYEMKQKEEVKSEPNEKDNNETVVESQLSPNETEKPESVAQLKHTTPVSKEEYQTYVVKAEDTLFSISMKFFQNRTGEALIKDANNLSAEGTVFEGQKLIIPNSK